MLLWKPSAFIVLPVIRNQSKPKVISLTFLSHSLTIIIHTKLSRFHGALLRQILDLEVVFSSSFKWDKVFPLKIIKKNHQKDASHLKNNKCSSHGERYKKDIEKREK